MATLPRELMHLVFSYVPLPTLERLRTMYSVARRVPVVRHPWWKHVSTNEEMMWYHEHYRVHMNDLSCKAIAWMASHGWLEVLQWIFAHFPELTVGDIYRSQAINVAMENGHVQVLQWMFAHFAELTVEVLRDHSLICIAAAYGQVEVLQWMFTHFTELTVDDIRMLHNWAMYLAAVHHRWPVMRWIIERFPQLTADDMRASDSVAIRELARHGPFDLLVLLFSTFPDLTTDDLPTVGVEYSIIAKMVAFCELRDRQRCMK